MDVRVGLQRKLSTKNWCFWTVVLEKTLESSLDCKEIKPVHPKGNQSWVFIGRTDVEAETPILWQPNVKRWPLEKTLMLGKIEDRRRRGWQKMRWLDGITNIDHHIINGHEFEYTPGVGNGQGGLACCNPWVAKSWTWLSNWTELKPSSSTNTTFILLPLPASH